MNDSDHPEIPPEEWDGRHINHDNEECALCGSDLEYLGDEYELIIRCEASDETLFLH